MNFISDENPQTAADFIDSIEKISENISQYTEMEFAPVLQLPVRQVLVKPARLLYITKENVIIIIACIHPSMDWQTLLLNRKIREL